MFSELYLCGCWCLRSGIKFYPTSISMQRWKKCWQQWYIGQHKQPIWGPKTNNIEPNWGFMTTEILLSSYMIMIVHNSDDIIIGFAFKLTITTIDIGHFNCQSNCQRNCQLSEQCLCSWKEWHNFWLENLQLFWDLRLIVWRSAFICQHFSCIYNNVVLNRSDSYKIVLSCYVLHIELLKVPKPRF